MKKLSKVFGASIIALSALALFSCVDDYDYDARTDTVITLDAPSVSGNAFYGVNHIWWSPVAEAKGYYVYRDGSYIGSVAAQDDLHYADKIIENGITYKYEVMATTTSVSTSVRAATAGTGVVILDGNKGSKELKAIVPTQEELDSAVYKSLSFSDSNSTTDKIEVSHGESGYFLVDFPAKAYLDYTVYVADTGKFNEKPNWQGEYSYDSRASTSGKDDVYKIEDYDAHFSIPYTSSGNKDVIVKVSARYLEKYSSLYVYSANATGASVKETLDLSSYTSNVSAVYTDEANKAVRVFFDAAKLSSTQNYAATSNYKVYRYFNGEYTELAGTVAESNIAGTYYIDDSVSDTALEFTYYAVLSINGAYESKTARGVLSASTSNIEKPVIESLSNVALDDDEVQNDIYFEAKAKADATLSLSYATGSTIQAAEANAKAGKTTAIILPEIYEISSDSNVEYHTYSVSVKDLGDAYYAVVAVSAENSISSSLVISIIKVDSTKTTAAVEKPSVQVSKVALDEDAVQNDLFITVKAKADATLSLSYASGTTGYAATTNAMAGNSTPITLPESYETSVDNGVEYHTYYVTVKNLSDAYYALAAISTEDRVSSAKVIPNAVQIDTTKKAEATAAPTLNVDLNDASTGFVVKASKNEGQTLSVVYGYDANSSSAAKANVYNGNAKSVSFVENVTTSYDSTNKITVYTYGAELSADAGCYYFVAIATEDGKAANQSVAEKTVSATEVTTNTFAESTIQIKNDTTTSISETPSYTYSANKNAIEFTNENNAGRTNDIKDFVVRIPYAGKLTHVYYATSSSEYGTDKAANVLVLSSKDELTIESDYRWNDSKTCKYYVVKGKDNIALDNYFAIRVVVEDGEDDDVTYASTSKVFYTASKASVVDFNAPDVELSVAYNSNVINVAVSDAYDSKDSSSEYTYTAYYAELNQQTGHLDGEWKKINTVELQYNSGDFVGLISTDDLDNEVYAVKVVKSRTDTYVSGEKTTEQETIRYIGVGTAATRLFNSTASSTNAEHITISDLSDLWTDSTENDGEIDDVKFTVKVPHYIAKITNAVQVLGSSETEAIYNLANGSDTSGDPNYNNSEITYNYGNLPIGAYYAIRVTVQYSTIDGEILDTRTETFVTKEASHLVDISNPEITVDRDSDFNIKVTLKDTILDTDEPKEYTYTVYAQKITNTDGTSIADYEEKDAKTADLNVYSSRTISDTFTFKDENALDNGKYIVYVKKCRNVNEYDGSYAWNDNTISKEFASSSENLWSGKYVTVYTVKVDGENKTVSGSKEMSASALSGIYYSDSDLKTNVAIAGVTDGQIIYVQE